MVVEEAKVDGDGVALVARTVTREAACPGCGAASGRVHGVYRRRLADLAVAGRKVVIDLLVRRFLCPTSACGHRTFVEQVDGLTERFARRTPPLRRTLEKIALALAGRPAARLAGHLSVPTSANSLLRLMRRLPDKQAGAAPRVLGVDDFALKKGHVYGMIILDMETGERVDVLPDRTAETLTAWLRTHPGAEIVCRDRASAYAEAVRTACPDAVQVADRFHLWKNLCEAVEKCVATHRSCLAEPAETTPLEVTAMREPEAADRGLLEPAEGLRVIQRHERHTAVHALYDKGIQIQVIAETLGLDRKTVRRYAHAATPDDASLATGPSQLRPDPFLLSLSAPALERGLHGLGTAARGDRRARLPRQQADRPPSPARDTGQRQTRTRQAQRTDRPEGHLADHRTPRQDQRVQRAQAQTTPRPVPRAGGRHRLRARLRPDDDRAPRQDLDKWLSDAERTGLKPLRSLARGLRQDLEAVTAGLTLEWSSGKVEGNVNRVKRIKRDGYGRAGFDLLRRQILLAD
ncbi:ISL3 family transposase [Streptomyces agglomeratus]|uniref:ISL3 family transposase n=1 Tax=Streptomyces agglomeratus TaxID=285458 RepID=UPI001F0B7088|nr:ISL3 family transposase [Streptomyces agglomeratus]